MPDYKYILKNAEKIIKKLTTHKQYIVAKELNLTPSQLSILLPLIKEVASGNCKSIS